VTGISHPGDDGDLRVGDAFDSPLERLRLLSGDDDAISTFLDELDVSSPREREMLAELARGTPLARPERFDADHRRAIEALESLRRHGFRGSQAGASLGPLKVVVRWLVELVARYLVVSHVKNVVTQMRNLYWAREVEAASNSPELKLLRPARFDAQALVEIMKSREIGVPSFVRRLSHVRDPRDRPHGRRLDRPPDPRRPRARDVTGAAPVWCPTSSRTPDDLPRAREPLNGSEQLLALLARDVRVTGGEGLGDAVRDVVLEKLRRDPFERRLHGRDLREDVDAVAVLLDHPLDPPHLPLDPVQALGERLLVLRVPVHHVTSRMEWKRRRRRLLVTTKTLENAIAAAATTGLSRPAIASGIAATL
jgi:hypothetical protein